LIRCCKIHTQHSTYHQSCAKNVTRHGVSAFSALSENSWNSFKSFKSCAGRVSKVQTLTHGEKFAQSVCLVDLSFISPSLLPVSEVYDYYRAIVCSGEKSTRAFELTK